MKRAHNKTNNKETSMKYASFICFCFSIWMTAAPVIRLPLHLNFKLIYLCALCRAFLFYRCLHALSSCVALWNLPKCISIFSCTFLFSNWPNFWTGQADASSSSCFVFVWILFMRIYYLHASRALWLSKCKWKCIFSETVNSYFLSFERRNLRGAKYFKRFLSLYAESEKVFFISSSYFSHIKFMMTNENLPYSWDVLSILSIFLFSSYLWPRYMSSSANKKKQQQNTHTNLLNRIKWRNLSTCTELTINLPKIVRVFANFHTPGTIK